MTGNTVYQELRMTVRAAKPQGLGDVLSRKRVERTVYRRQVEKESLQVLLCSP